MNLHLTGKHALVCGASRGIGRAAAEALAGLGADVTVLARDRDALDALARTLPKMHGTQRHGWLAADVADTIALRSAVEAMVAAHPVQILINNTGGPNPGLAIEASGDQFVDTFRRHLLASHALVQATIGGMRAAGYGRIINVISTSVKEPIRNLGVSNTIRGAVASWAKTLAAELAPHGITVNNVLPGFTRTQRLEQIIAERVAATGKSRDEIESGMLASVPAARFAEAAEVAAAIAFLASPAASYINGINLPVDGGRTQSL
ncbi:MAG: SDR family oxidoreductase [Xanthomonadales bacterium]|nr:SDR family oxidoreductase [Xanthomonadales bacterium]MBK7145293.1 SDR family oxidoreductase [Xanthomonadales bacterium]MCC6561016.1 SDR family oxidoreductase [Xanthomonadales bacterium]